MAVSTIKGIQLESSISKNLQVASGTNWVLADSVELTAGLWFVFYGASFTQNNSGHRRLHLGTSANSVGRLSPTQQAVQGDQTRMSSAQTWNASETTTLNLYASQNSGSALTVYPWIIAVKIA